MLRRAAPDLILTQDLCHVCAASPGDLKDALARFDTSPPQVLSLNPNRLVPFLIDGDLKLSESSAILKYLAERFESVTYPRELKARARVNELMDWINTQLCRDLAYGLVYPQVFPTHKRPSEEQQKAQLAWSCERAKSWMKVLDESILGPKNKYLCGDKITLADYFAASFVSLAEFIR